MRAVTALAAAAAAAAAPLTGTLYGVFAPSGNPLTELALLSVDPNTGDNATVAELSLGPLTTTFPAKSAYDASLKRLLVACASSDGVYEIALSTGKASQLAPLPAYNDSDPFLGLAVHESTVYLLTQHALFTVGAGALQQVADLSSSGLPDVAQVTLDASAGSLVVGDTENPVLYTIAVGDGSYDVATAKTGVPSALWDLQYSAYLKTLVAVAGYQLYTVDAASGKTKKVANVVDGPGYPKVNTVDPTGRYFAFFDFANLHVIDLSTFKALDAGGAFIGAPRAVGFPVWVDA